LACQRAIVTYLERWGQHTATLDEARRLLDEMLRCQIQIEKHLADWHSWNRAKQMMRCRSASRSQFLNSGLS
jgi:hypothetical protein